MTPTELAKHIANAAKEKKATDISIIETKGFSDLCEYQVICSVQNSKQNQAVCDNIEQTLRQNGNIRPYVVEGKQAGNWILLDYGPVVGHIFLDQIRSYYALEELWPKAKRLQV